jgi:hypothetical protein
LNCILAVSSCCEKDLRVITEGGGLAVHFRELENALSFTADDVFGNYWWYAFNTNNVCFRGYVNVAPLHLFIKLEARQVANRLLGNGCSYVPNFGHSEVLNKMTEMLLLLAPRDQFVTLNIFDMKFSVDFPAAREDWSTECVDFVAPDGLVFFTDGSLCKGRAGASVLYARVPENHMP